MPTGTWATSCSRTYFKFRAMAIITLLTDFGTTDSFVGIMKGVILQINPQADIVDISHGIDRGGSRRQRPDHP